MLRSVGPLFTWASLLLVFLEPTTSLYLSHQPSSSANTFTRYRNARQLSPTSLHRRSIYNDDDGPLSNSFDLSDFGDTDLRRSLRSDGDGEDAPFKSIDQMKDEANQMWQQFVAPTSDEEFDSYPDDSDCSESDDSVPHPSDPSKPESQVKGPTASEIAQKKKQELADDKAKKQAEKAKEQEAAREASDAEKAKEQESAREASAHKLAEEASAKKASEAEKKKKDAAADQKKKEAEAKKEQASTSDEDESPSQTAPTKPVITDLSKIPGTPVVTGTAHTAHEGDQYSSPSSDQHSGDATYYDPGLGACGLTNGPGDMIVAVSKLLYDTYPSEAGNPNTNKVCGKRIRASYEGRSVDVTVVDRCEACDKFSLDFTITAFEKLGPKDEGRLHGMTWTWI